MHDHFENTIKTHIKLDLNSHLAACKFLVNVIFFLLGMPNKISNCIDCGTPNTAEVFVHC